MRKLTYVILFIISIATATAQTGMLENFNDNLLDPNWKSVPTNKFSFNESSGQLLVTPYSVGPGYENFEYSFSPVDLTSNPTVTVKIQNASAFTLRVDLVDNTGKSTNSNPVSKSIGVNSSFSTITFDFTNKFTQSGGGIVDKTKISKVVFFINAGGNASSNPITLDDVTVGDPIISTPGSIVLNQVGYELNGAKTAIFTYSANSLTPTTFDLLSSTNAVVYTGNIVSKGAVAGWTNRYFWELNFSSFQTPGIYKIRVGTKISYPFEIGQNILFTKTAYSVVDFFKGMRSTVNADKTLSFNGPRNDQVNVYGGWRDATGDPGKHMSHLSYANYFNPQQIPFVVWSLLKSYEMSQSSFTAKSTDLLNESKWGADYLLRNIDAQQNYLYLAIFDDWGNNPGSREICEWGQPGSGNDGARTANYQAAMREGAGVAIAALARAYRMNLNGDSTKTQYLNGAIRLYTNLKAAGNGYATKNLEYCNDHTENMIDFYCGLLATIELYKATNNAAYLTDAAAYADKIISMQDPQGWFKSDVAGTRPFYHAADEGLPLISLMEYMDIDASKNTTIKQVITKNITWYMSISKEVNNPFNYMREYCKPSVNGTLGNAKKAFFLPHDNETGYWWQGENARLASMSTALLLAGRKLNSQFILGTDSLSTYGIAQLDWILGKNPFDVCMMTGAGTTTYPNYPAGSAIPNVTGGICNGITCKNLEETNIDWMPYASTDWNNWRWIEQWLPHDAWFLLALSSIDVDNTTPPTPPTAPVAGFTSSLSTVCTAASTVFTNTSTGSITSYTWNFGTDASIASASTSGPFTISWSTPGSKTISLTTTGPGGTSTKTMSLLVNAVPSAAGIITGVTNTCPNSSNVKYYIAQINTATGYNWTLPTGALITAGSNTDAITVSFATTGGTIQVAPTNICGTGTASSIAVTVSTTGLPTAAGPISGPTSVCNNSTGILYSIPTSSNATAYIWTLPTGATITAGSNTSAITVSFGTTGGTVQATPTNSCGNASPSNTTVSIKNVPAAADAIVGSATPCYYSIVSYSISPIAGATAYNWTLPTGATITAGSNTNAITVMFTVNGGAIQVTPANTCGNGISSNTAVTIVKAPIGPGDITGPGSVCANSIGNTYSVDPVPNATGYDWFLPTGAVITAGSNTNAITVSFTTDSGTIDVAATNYCGANYSAASSKDIKITPPPSDAGKITGLASTCTNSTGVTYSIPAIATATGYNWTLPTGATITAGSNTNAITVSFATTAGTIQVTPKNMCGNATPASKTVTLTNKPTAAGTITGVASTCANSTGITYSIPAITTATGYNWTLPTGASITAGSNTRAITVSFAATGGTIQVTPTNTCGNATPATKTIALTPVPTAAGTITGVASACANSTGITYSIPAITTATGYNWTLPTGASITAGSNTNAITVSFATTAGTVQVTPTNTCGNGTSATTSVTLVTAPTTTGTITGASTTCANSTGVTYSIPAISSATTYNWILPAGATITAGSNTNAITVSFATTGGTIQVTPTNTCGNSSPSATAVTLTTVPTAAGTISGGSTSACANSSNISYSITAVATATGYNWTLPTGAVITTGANTNAITVAFATSGGTIQVIPTNACGNGTGSSTGIEITPIGTSPCLLPITSSITGPSTVSPNQQNVTYSVTANAGSTYNWSLPAGAAIVSGQGTNTIVVNFGTSGGSVSVQETNSYGTGAAVTKPITLSVPTDIILTSGLDCSLYPNPTNEFSIITFNNITTDFVQISVIDIKGVILSTTEISTSEAITIGHTLASGVYIIQIKLGDAVITKRLVKI